MADYIGTATGQQIDALPGKVSQLEQKVGDLALEISDDFDATKTYAVKDVVRKDGKLYICNTAITTASAWDASKWTMLTNIQDLIPMADDETLETVSGVMSIKDEGVTFDKTEEGIQTILNICANLIEVKEEGFFVVDQDLNVGFAAQYPTDYGLGLKNE